MDRKRLLELRNKLKRKKPRFVVRESNFCGRVKERWRYPQGKHSAVREEHKGRPALVTIGYGSPKAVRGLHSSGLEKVVVHTARELRQVHPDRQGAVIASGVGNRKRVELLTLAVEKKIRVLNIRDPQGVVEIIKKDLVDRRKVKAERQHTKVKKQEEKTQKAEEKKKKEAEEKAKPEHDHEEHHEKIKEEQKEIAEKTIIKPQ